LINPAASAIVVIVVIVVVATVVVIVIAVAVLGAVVSLVADLSAAEASSLANTPVMYVGGHGRRVAVVVIIVAAAEGLAQLIQSSVDVVKLHGEVVRLHGGGGGGRGRGRRVEGRYGGTSGDGEGGRGGLGTVFGLEMVDAVHFFRKAEDVSEGEVGVLNEMALNHLLEGEGAVVDKRGLCKIADRGLGRVVGGMAKKGPQKLSEHGQERGEVGGHAEVC